MWGIFKKHHYLSGEFNKASQFFLIYWNESLVGMASVLPVPSGVVKNAFRQHRLVILPDFQGLGIGTKINDFLGEYFISIGLKYYMRTTHVRLIRHMSHDKRWIATSHNNRISDANSGTMKFNDLTRVCGAYEFVGEDYNNKPHKNILINETTINEKNRLKFIKYLKKLKNEYYLTITTGSTQKETEIEFIAKKLGIRTELLYVKKNGEYIIKKNIGNLEEVLISDICE